MCIIKLLKITTDDNYNFKNNVITVNFCINNIYYVNQGARKFIHINILLSCV